MKSLFQTIMSPIRDMVYSIVDILDRKYTKRILMTIPKQEHDGFTLYYWATDSPDTFFKQAVDALDFLKSIDLRRYQRAKSHMPNIVLAGFGYDHYKSNVRAFFVDTLMATPSIFAESIVHEATHAYLLDRGFKYNHDSRERHERICVSEQIRFQIKATMLDPAKTENQKIKSIQELKKGCEKTMETHWWVEKITQQRILNGLKKIFFKNCTTKLYYHTGKIWKEETFKNGNRHGPSKIYRKDGRLKCESHYENDLFHGDSKVYSDDGSVREGVYVHGSIEGTVTEYYPNGNVKSRTKYLNNQRDGKYEIFYENGVLKQEGFYTKNLANGQSKFYRDNGILKSTAEYIDGKIQGDAIFYKDNLDQ